LISTRDQEDSMRKQIVSSANGAETIGYPYAKE